MHGQRPVPRAVEPLQGAGETAHLALVEDPAGPAAEPLLVGHRREHPARGQLGPPGVQEVEEVRLGGDVLVEGGAQFGGEFRVGVAAPARGLVPQGVQQQPAGARAQQVDRCGAAEDGLPDAVEFVGVQLDAGAERDDPQPGGGGRGGVGFRVLVAEGQLAVPVRRRPAGRTGLFQCAPGRLAQHLEHPRGALDPGDGGVVVGGGALDAGRLVGERADGTDRDLPLLAQRGQHAFGVRDQERGRRYDEDAARVTPPVLVEEVRGAVQGDGRLAGAGAAGDLGDRGGGGADHQVLFGLDGGDDVPHGVAAGLAERSHQGAVPDHRQLGAVQVRGQLGAHQVVLDPEYLAALGADDPAAHDPAGFLRRRPVERCGSRRAPVDDQRRVVGVEDPDPADVQRLRDLGRTVVAYRVLGRFDGGVRAVRAAYAVLAEQQVDPPEEEVLELAVQPVEVDSGPEHLGVALGERPRGTHLAALDGVIHEKFRLVDLLLKAVINTVEMFLLDTDFPVPQRIDSGILRGHRGPLLTCIGQPSTLCEG